jgi:hypothetical protein
MLLVVASHTQRPSDVVTDSVNKCVKDMNYNSSPKFCHTKDWNVGPTRTTIVGVSRQGGP